MPTLLWSLAKAGRRDPVEVWGPAGETPQLGTRAYLEHLQAAHAWDLRSLGGHPGQSGAHAVTTEVPYDTTTTVYERNGVRITSFPVIHMQNGAVGYRLDYAGRSVVFSGDTRPCRTLVAAADGADLLIHETFPSPSVFAKKAGVPLAHAELVVNGVHTSPTMVGKGVHPRRRPDVSDVALRRRPRDRRTGPRRDAHPTRRRRGHRARPHRRQPHRRSGRGPAGHRRPTAWPVLGPTKVTGPPMSPLPEPPAWWADALITD